MTENLLNLKIGSELRLDSLSDVVLNNLTSELIDCAHGENLMITHPEKDGIPVQVSTGERFMVGAQQHDEDICFETEVVAVLNDPYPHLLTSYPVNVREGAIRQSNRVPAAPANVHLVVDGDIDATPISILNVSTAGACLVADQQLGRVDDLFQISFATEDGAEGFAFTCMLRHVHEVHNDDQTKFSHGVVFIGMDAEDQLFLWKYFKESASLHF